MCWGCTFDSLFRLFLKRSDNEVFFFHFVIIIYIQFAVMFPCISLDKTANFKSLHIDNNILLIYIYSRCLLYSVTAKTISGRDCIYIYIYIYVWKLNQTVLEFDFRAVKFLFFPRRDLNPHHCYTAAPFA
jgi:hypothetical protein